jgi:serine phosphatase RsbU (regulator of sigma subunit)
MDYEEKETVLEAGDRLFLYSDGLVEAHNTGREMFGSSRLQAKLDVNPGSSGLIDSLLNHLAAFTGPGWEQEDDITAVILERSHHQPG